MISQIELTTETTLTDYIAYVALCVSTMNCIACQCFHKILQRRFEKLPERQIPLQTVAVAPRRHKNCKRCDKPKPIGQRSWPFQSDRQGHNRGKEVLKRTFMKHSTLNFGEH